jgi:predicted XRE-type DNA-binding protein
MREAGYRLDCIQNNRMVSDVKPMKQISSKGVRTMTNQRFKSVWDAIESTPINAASMKARSKLMMEITSVIEKNEMTQTQAAQLFGVTQPRISDLMRGKINLFSLDTLMNMAATAGMSPEVKLSRPKLQMG